MIIDHDDFRLIQLISEKRLKTIWQRGGSVKDGNQNRDSNRMSLIHGDGEFHF
jgi:hypothetical protein